MTSAKATVTTITPAELFELSRNNRLVDLIDVRTPAEFREVHIPFARSTPLERLDPVALMSSRDESAGPLYVICRSGSRGRKACHALAEAGYADRVVNIEGGTLAWEQAGYPVVRGKKTISLERQIRIIAGSLVVLGVVLGAVVDPWFTGLSAFVGAGLVFAGVTDICPMAMGLARMPWNQAGGEAQACVK